MDKTKALNHLLTFKKISEQMHFVFWLDNGTCLGAVRENDFMDSDFDVDVAMWGEDDYRIPDIIARMKEEGFDHFHHKRHPSGNGQQISCIRDGISMDIYFWYKRDGVRYRVMFDITPANTVRYMTCVIPADMLDAFYFRPIDFMGYGEEFRVPGNAEEYLTLLYGNWKIDKKKSEFKWQTDYKCYDPDFTIVPLPPHTTRWVDVRSLSYKPSCGAFFAPYIKSGFKLFLPLVNASRQVVDGNKRVSAYVECGVPMVEVLVLL